jgi:voltage-gated potassium channel
MKMKRPTPLNELSPFQIVILVLSLFVLVTLCIELIFTLPEETSRLLRWIDTAVCFVFLADFIIRFRRAESKLQFMKWGWIDLLASIPEIEALRWGRVFRVFRIIRLLRAVRSLRLIFEILFRSRAKSGMASIFMITFLMLSLSSVGVLVAETDEHSNIRTAEDAAWWSLTTITTVGYGDRYPVTLPGRLIAGALMITGVGLFGTLSGVVASFFLGDKTKKEPAPAETDDSLLLAEVQRLRAELAALRPVLGNSAAPPAPDNTST